MIDKFTNDARVYTDVQGLEQLRYQSKTDASGAKKEVAKQFEAMMMQMVMRSMRDANKTFSSDLFGSNDQLDFYQDLFDKQLSLLSTNNPNGLSQMIEKNMDQQFNLKEVKPHAKTEGGLVLNAAPAALPLKLAPKINTQTNHAEPTQPSLFATPQAFVKTLWKSAKFAASLIGADPKILLAQAALETNWGKKILHEGDTLSSHNLFNIKADPSWDKKTTTMTTIEQTNGVLRKEKATFRSYGSYQDSFMDYVKFLKENGRYSQALDKASEPQQFVQALQQAGFATDQRYAEKIWNIFSSQSFKHLVEREE